ncbi:hypothetical protein IMSHALPRED_006165 [Imshaugia aleurites]|uniref:Heterokaryon incompatibility domain-containing protein n=1 Tax=Imshaugia aleurites TaxID=172621 RepID=A0A8H3IME7_9LECA|nr:hypothetical protein IMSHALPRED_006165 [Imshaugia aleurites]
MRLINTTTLEFHEFFDRDIPEYAILSHRWGSDEASFQDFEKGVQQSRGGFAKIEQCCNLALKDCYEWAWIDTCCIDKKSSAELTEAINSMYNWYGRAKVCYVYLNDVAWEKGTSESLQASMDGFRESSWFTRGWTLQELLAPPSVSFLDQNWQYIGTKDDLAREISEITGIDTQYFLPDAENKIHEPCTKAPDCRGHPPRYKYITSGKLEPSVATRMSWASKRQISRIEDMAYCLLGIFDVNMPLLYGEGPKAFLRLQYEIMKQTSDDSIFAWTADQEVTGVLAYWPSNFASSRYVHEQAPLETRRRPYAMTNQGLHLPITWRARGPKRGLRVMLDCGICGPQGFKNIVLCFKPVIPELWFRVHTYQIETMEEGPWHNPLDPSKSNPIQDVRTSNHIKARSVRKMEDPRTQADQLSELSEITVMADWWYGEEPPGRIYDSLKNKT